MSRLHPLPRVCRVCRGACVVRLVSLLGIPTAARTPCPHCIGVGEPVRISDLPYREDIPNGAA